MNFVLRAMTLRYPPIQSRMRYRASQHFYDVIEGEVGALRKPMKIFVIQCNLFQWKGARYLSSFFFFNEHILLYYRGGRGRKLLLFKLNGFKMSSVRVIKNC